MCLVGTVCDPAGVVWLAEKGIRQKSVAEDVAYLSRNFYIKTYTFTLFK